MKFDVNVDIGGTFTDLYISNDQGCSELIKTPTTHYDLSVGFLKGVSEAGRRFDLDPAGFLSRVETVRYCTTVGTNALIERTGPKLALITTAGFEDTVYIGRARSWADGGSPQENRDLGRIAKPQPLIRPDMVAGVRERIDSAGNVVCPLRPEDVRSKLQTLVDRGAMGFVVCLLWSFNNPVHEQMIKSIIEEEYPEDYLGSMPVTLSSDISPKSGEYTRFVTAIVNAYIHGVMADELGRLVNELRNGGYKRPLVLVHNTGGVKKVSRTRAVYTHNAGPVAGLQGALTLGRSYGWDNIVFTDMGGTSFDIGVITGGRLRTYDFIPVIDRWRTNIPAIEVKSIGAGGGSIAWINKLMDNALEVGPRSAGSMPGPACYDQGGLEPTVTDADLVLGYLNPDNYLGGRLSLDPDLSREVIMDQVARPLNLEVVQAAAGIKRLVDAKMGQEVFNEVALKGHDPREFMLFACGGAGATHATGIAPYLGATRVMVPACSPVSGAFGASTVPCQQVWEKSRTLKLFQWASQAYSDQAEDFNQVVDELKEMALRDMALEGYPPDSLTFELVLEMRFGMQYNMTKIVSPHLNVSGPEDYRDICDQFIREYSAVYSPEATFPRGGINVECFYLTARVDQPLMTTAGEETEGEVPAASARTGKRPAFWIGPNDFLDTPVFTFEELKPGNRIEGPALVEARHTTFVVDPGWRLTLDPYRNCLLEMI
jgi:N-methylhydantoinase A/acetophenone carboxylase